MIARADSAIPLSISPDTADSLSDVEPDDDAPVYSLAEVAEIVGKAESTMRLWARTGELETVKIGGKGKHFVRRSELQRVMQDHGIESLSHPGAEDSTEAGAETFDMVSRFRG